MITTLTHLGPPALRQPSRVGLTMIEVLTSIVVAMIGVFGIMILIPFAVKQSQSGLDSDAAVNVGRNAVAQFQIGGYHAPESWSVFDQDKGWDFYSPFGWRYGLPPQSGLEPGLFPHLPRILSIDPLGFWECGPSYTIPQRFGIARFPYHGYDSNFSPNHAFGSLSEDGIRYPAEYMIDVATLNDQPPTALGLPPKLMSLGSARNLMRSQDDLVFTGAGDGVEAPIQGLNTWGFEPLSRQSSGRISWSAIVVPQNDSSPWWEERDQNFPEPTNATERWPFKLYVLVYKDRNTSIWDNPNLAPLVAADEDRGMATAKVIDGTVVDGGGTIFLGGVSAIEGSVNRDDWVMLIKQLSGDPDGTEKRRIQFYRVVNVSNPVGNVSASLSLAGPAFDFNDAKFGTYVVHLKNVVGVYERGFEAEDLSALQ